MESLYVELEKHIFEISRLVKHLLKSEEERTLLIAAYKEMEEELNRLKDV